MCLNGIESCPQANSIYMGCIHHCNIGTYRKKVIPGQSLCASKMFMPFNYIHSGCGRLYVLIKV